MRSNLMLSLAMAAAFAVSCRERDAIGPENAADENSSLIIETEKTQPTEEAKGDPAPKAELPAQKPEETPANPDKGAAKDPPIVIENQPTPRIESLVFAHSNGMCLQVNPNGRTNLQPCDAKAAGQKFLFSRSLDGRVQLKDTASELCLAVGPSSVFSSTLLLGEVCESKSRQFFSVVDYGTNYSLKFDEDNTCVDAESKGVIAGTRFVLYKCSAVLNQKIQVVKK